MAKEVNSKEKSLLTLLTLFNFQDKGCTKEKPHETEWRINRQLKFCVGKYKGIHVEGTMLALHIQGSELTVSAEV